MNRLMTITVRKEYSGLFEYVLKTANGTMQAMSMVYATEKAAVRSAQRLIDNGLRANLLIEKEVY